MPPGSPNCNGQWAEKYNLLIERFQAVVKMQLFGHDANDYF